MAAITPCRFFALGSCKYGESCRFSHDSVRAGRAAQLRANAPDFVPFVPKAAVVCRYFASNSCMYGDRCQYLHDTPSGDPEGDLSASMQIDREPDQVVEGLSVSEQQAIDEELFKLHSELLNSEQAARAKMKPDGTLEEDIHGAVVVYGPGAEVKSVRLRSDFSHLQILGLPNTANELTVMEFLKVLGFDVPVEQIDVYAIGNEQSLVATVRFDDADTAKQIAEKADAEMGPGSTGQFTIKIIPPRARFGNWMQFNTIALSWYRRSKRATLQFSHPNLMNQAKALLEKLRNPSGRALRCRLILDWGRRNRNRFLIEVGNLEWDATAEWINGALQKAIDESAAQNETGHNDSQICPPLPRSIRIMDPMDNMDEHESMEAVESLLKSIGPVESFSVYDEQRSMKLKATAVFLSPHHTSQAVQKLNESVHDDLGKLFVERVSSVKFNVPEKIARSLRQELQAFQNRIQRENNLKMKQNTTDSSPMDKPYVKIQFWAKGGDAPKHVAVARSELEKILKGAVVLDSGKAFWHHFFRTPGSLPFLSNVSSSCGLYVHRDLSREQIVIYGGVPYTRDQAAKQLLRKVRQLEKTELKSTPKRTTNSSKECVTCFTVEEKSVITSCGHTYCEECLLGQVRSADEQTLPLICHGEQDTCKKIFALKELRELVPLPDFDNLLAVSLKAFIRTRPTEYAYCPTPDCASVYRVKPEATSAEEKVIFCTECLSAICMTCCTPTHDDTSCANNAAAKLDAELAIYKAENNTKDCPNCETMLEKVDGCNHMMCPICLTHICWVCLQTFGTVNGDRCYSHLRQVHGGFGLFGDDDNNDDNDDDDDDDDDDDGLEGEDITVIVAAFRQRAAAAAAIRNPVQRQNPIMNIPVGANNLPALQQNYDVLNHELHGPGPVGLANNMPGRVANIPGGMQRHPGERREEFNRRELDRIIGEQQERFVNLQYLLRERLRRN